MERDACKPCASSHLPISTHTLTWSVTAPALLRYVHGGYFNSHAHVERDQEQPCDTHKKEHFNSHAHVERDQNGYDLPENISDFNSHAHVERDLDVLCDTARVTDFNSHAHVERD